MNLNTFTPTIAGVTGGGLLAITPDLHSVTEIVIALTTVIIQIIALFKKKKSVS